MDKAGRDVKKDILAVCRSVADATGYELVDAGIEKENAGRFLRIYLDSPGGITLNDCETYHRAVQPLLERFDYDYLEVSSPGADRPLKTRRDFDRHAGDTVTVKLYKSKDGLKTYEGRLIGLCEGEILIRSGEEVLRFTQRDVASVKPAISLDGLY